MNKCQQLIDKVSELRFLKVRERQMNKFNRLLLKREGNITWLVPASTLANRANPQAGSASTVPPQEGSSQAESTDPQAVSTSPQVSQAVSNFQADSASSQGDSAVPPRQEVSRQTALIPRQSALLKPSRQLIIPRQKVLVPRGIMMSYPRQVVPSRQC